MDEQETRILFFSEDDLKINFLENFCLKEAEDKCHLDLGNLQTSAEEIFLNYMPALIFIDFESIALDEQLALMERLERVALTIPVIGFFTMEQKEVAYEYMKKGLHGVLDLPLTAVEINRAIFRYKKAFGKPSSSRRAQTFTFFSFKGGVGNTFVTLNTATSMARLTKKKVLLWDMDLQAGDIPFYLDYKPKYTISDLLDNLDLLDESYIEGVLSPHESGVSILACPKKIEDLDMLNSQKIEKIFNLLAQSFDYIFIDGGYRLTDSLIPVIDLSTYLFITTTLEIVALRSASHCLDILERIQVPSDRIKIVINRYLSKKESIKIEQAREILRLDFAQLVSNDYQVATKTANLGQCVADAAPNSQLDKDFSSLAKKLESRFKDNLKKRKVLGRISEALNKAVGHK
jgi:pilus assembly protein CpaE